MSTNTEKTYIEAFPISTSDELDDKLLTEKNITNIIKHICGRNSFIIGEVTENVTGGTKTYIEFILDGYYFKIEKPDTQGKPTWYASITYDNDVFKSLSLTTIQPSGNHLQLLSGGSIYQANKIRLSADLVENPEFPTITSIKCVW